MGTAEQSSGTPCSNRTEITWDDGDLWLSTEPTGYIHGNERYGIGRRVNSYHNTNFRVVTVPSNNKKKLEDDLAEAVNDLYDLTQKLSDIHEKLKLIRH